MKPPSLQQGRCALDKPPLSHTIIIGYNLHYIELFGGKILVIENVLEK